MTTYLESKIDNNIYCKTNGQFSRHLRKFNLTYQQYYEQYVTGTSPKCQCGDALAFYQKNLTYAKSCGSPACVGKSGSVTKKNLPPEVKQQQSANYRASSAAKTPEEKKLTREKANETYRLRYNAEPGNSVQQKEKSRASKLARYGNEHYSGWEKSAKKNRSKTPEEKDRINNVRRRTNVERFGVTCVFLVPGAQEKSAKSNVTGKDFILPSGNIVEVRGYEGIVISKLLAQKYSEDQLVIHNSKEPYLLPVFEYVTVNQHSARYYPDIYIPHENKIIEVKARFWWDGANTKSPEKYKSRLENNLRKKKAVIDKGFTYEVWLFDDRNTYTVIT